MKRIKKILMVKTLVLYFFVKVAFSYETGPIIINEIYPFSGNKDEWVELKNRSNISINLKNWQLSDLTKTSIITFNDYFLNPGEVVLIVKSDNNFKNSSMPYIKMQSWVVLNNDKDIISLRLPNSELISDSINYNKKFFKDTQSSISRLKEDVYAIHESDWYSSFPTPGYIGQNNNNYVENIKYDLQCTPLIFTPNNDGVDDFLSIQVIGKYGEVYKLEIYDFSGRLCFTKNIFSNEIFNWNGEIESLKALKCEPIFVVVKFTNDKYIRKKAVIWN